jgi:hypothetical protein
MWYGGPAFADIKGNGLTRARQLFSSRLDKEGILRASRSLDGTRPWATGAGPSVRVRLAGGPMLATGGGLFFSSFSRSLSGAAE